MLKGSSNSSEKGETQKGLSIKDMVYVYGGGVEELRVQDGERGTGDGQQ